MPQKVELSYKTILFTIFLILGLWFVWGIKEILFLVFLSFIAAAGLRTPVTQLEDKLKVPRIVAILIIYTIMLFIIFIFLAVMIPAFAEQSTRLIQKLIYFFSLSVFSPYLDVSTAKVTEQLTAISGNVFRATLGVFSVILNLFTFFVLTFYLLLERRHMRVLLKNLLGEQMKERFVNMLLKMELRLGSWVRGEATLVLIIGVLSYIGLTLLNIEYALPLALLAGLLEVVPIVGPIISAIPAVIVASLVSPWLALATASLYFLIQQLENHIIVPLVMKQAVGVPPVVTILAILVGGRLYGIMGSLLAIPLFICIQIVFLEFFSTSEEDKPDSA